MEIPKAVKIQPPNQENKEFKEFKVFQEFKEFKVFQEHNKARIFRPIYSIMDSAYIKIAK